MQSIATTHPTNNAADPAEYDLETLLAQIGRSLQGSLPYLDGGLLFTDSATRLLYPRLYFSTRANAHSPRLFNWNEGHFKTIAESHRGLRIDQIDNSHYLRCDRAACSAIVAPILQGDHLLGVVFVESEQEAAYTDLHLKMLTFAAEQVALVTTLIDRYGDLNQRYRRLSAYNDQMLLRNEISRLITDDLLSETLWPRLTDYLARFSRADECAITIWDESREEVQLLGLYSEAALQPMANAVPVPALSFDWENLTRKMALSPGPLILSEPTDADPSETRLRDDHVQALLGMPLIARQKYVGAVILASTSAAHLFSVLDVAQLTSVLDKIGLTIDNNALFRNLQTQLSEASALLEVGRIATSNPDVTPMLNQVIEYVCRSMDAEIGVLLLHDSATKTLQVRIEQSARPGQANGELAQTTIPANDAHSMTARTFRTGTGYFTNRLGRDDQTRAYTLYHKLGLEKVLEVPIRILDRSLGVVIIGNKTTDFTDADLNFLSAVCNYLSSALYNADLLEQMRHQLNAADTMRGIANITGSGKDVDDILSEVTERVARLVEAPGAVVYLFDQRADWLYANDRSRYGAAIRLTLPIVHTQDQNPIAETFRRREIQVQPQLTAREAYTIESISVITYPLHIHQQTLGVLVIFGLDLDTLYDDNYQIESMQAAAAQIAVSIENTQLFTAERRRANLMALIVEIGQALASQLDIRGLTRSVVKSVHELLNYDAVFLYTLDEDDEQITLASAATHNAEMRLPDDSKFLIGSGVVGRAFATGNIEYVFNRPGSSDVYWPGSRYRSFSELVFPLRDRNKVIGALEIVSTRPTGFHEMERTALGTLASQISTAMENARLWDEARNRLVEEQIVSQIGNVLVSILDYKQLGEAIVQQMARALDTSSCLLVRYEDETDEALVEAEYRPPDLAIGTPKRRILSPDSVEGQIVRRAIHSRRLALYPDADSHDPLNAPVPVSAKNLMPLSSAIALPLIARDHTIGCMLWVETRVDRRILASDIRLAQTLTTQAAIAVENARLFAELEERAFELAKANSLKSDFLARVSHELRTPLNSIIGYSDLLLNLQYGSLNEKQFDRLERVRRNGANLLRLIDDLLDISKIDAGKMEFQIEPLSVIDNLRPVVETLDNQVVARGLTLHIDIPPDLPLVLGDSFRFRQVLTNLISNAIKFTMQGSITIQAEAFIAQDRLMVLVSVTDTGIGISPNDQKMVFDEFQQVISRINYRQTGTGLGLSIVRRFVELMGGRVWVESTLGEGSTFFFTLHAAPDLR